MQEDLKSRDTCVQECVSIRRHLQSVGALVEEKNARRVKEEMNAFLQNPPSPDEHKSSSFALRICEGKAVARVVLARKKGVQSGVTLER